MSSAEPPPDWAALYLAHRGAMYGAAARALRAAGLADQAGDAVQDAIESLMKSPPERVQNWEAFLVTVAKRKALDRLKSAGVRKTRPELSDERHPSAVGSDVAEDVSEELDRHRLAAKARGLIESLPARDREVVLRCVVGEDSQKEVAADLGVTPGRVSQMIKAALEQLRAKIQEGER